MFNIPKVLKNFQISLDIDRHTAEFFNELRNFMFCVLERFLDDFKAAAPDLHKAVEEGAHTFEDYPH